MKLSSIGQVIGSSVYEDDFWKRFSVLDGAVALRLDERFAGWKFVITEKIAIKHTEICELLD